MVRYETDGCIIPEYISEGLAATTEMPLEETWKLYREDALTGVHPEDLERVRTELGRYLTSGKKPLGDRIPAFERLRGLCMGQEYALPHRT